MLIFSCIIYISVNGVMIHGEEREKIVITLKYCFRKRMMYLSVYLKIFII